MPGGPARTEKRASDGRHQRSGPRDSLGWNDAGRSVLEDTAVGGFHKAGQLFGLGRGS